MIKIFHASLLSNDHAALPDTWNIKSVETVEQADLVMFSGGTDISSAIYREPRDPHSQVPDIRRDLYELSTYVYCKRNNTPMIGICRGSQFLWAAEGGKINQHLSVSHNCVHDVECADGQVIKVNSTHHQCAVFPTQAEDAVIIAKELHSGDIEMWSTYNCFGCQSHPEYLDAPKELKAYFRDQVEYWLTARCL